MKTKSLICSLFAFAVTTAMHATISVSNLVLNDATDTISFDITGSIPAGANIGGTNSNTLFIGDPGDDDWITSNGTDESITNNNASTVQADAAFYVSFGNGNHIAVQRVGNWAPGDQIDASISITGGTIVAANLNPSNLIVAAGLNSISIFPDVSTQVSVPEPSTYAALAGALALGLVAWRRRRG